MEKLKGKIVLIVDDEERNIFALSAYLETISMVVKKATNGKEAITLLSADDKVDIILLDMMMPVMDGYETLQTLKQHGTLKHIPVIAVTARAMVGDKEKCMEAGAWDYISKPIDTYALIDKLGRWIQ